MIRTNEIRKALEDLPFFAQEFSELEKKLTLCNIH